MTEQSARHNIAAIKDEPVDVYSENESGQAHVNVENEPADVKSEIIAAGDCSADVVEDVRPPYAAAVKQELDIGLTVLQPLNVQLQMATASSNDTCDVYVPMTTADQSSRHDPAAIKCEPDDLCSDNESGHVYIHVKSEPADVKTETIAIESNCVDDVRPLDVATVKREVEIELTPLPPLDIPFSPWTHKQKPADDSPQAHHTAQHLPGQTSSEEQHDIRAERCTEQTTLILQLHTAKRPYTCDVCSKSFTRKDTLVTHMNIHTCKRRYSCEVCSKSFTRKHDKVNT